MYSKEKGEREEEGGRERGREIEITECVTAQPPAYKRTSKGMKNLTVYNVPSYSFWLTPIFPTKSRIAGGNVE